MKLFILLAVTFGFNLAWADHDGWMDHLQRNNCCYNVDNPENSIGEDDGNFATIHPGGYLNVWINHNLYLFEDGEGDDLTVYADDSSNGVYDVHINLVNQRGYIYADQSYGFSAFDFSSLYLTQKIEAVRIENNSDVPVYIDAIKASHVVESGGH